MKEYQIKSYVEQCIDSSNFKPKGKPKTRFAVYLKEFPFPNKSIFQWVLIKDGFKTEKEAFDFHNSIL